MAKCGDLPDLEEEGQNGGNWRDQRNDDGYADRGFGGGRGGYN